MTDLTDEQLVRQFVAGDERAFAVLHARYVPKLLNVAMSRLHCLPDAEEVVADTFIRAHRKLAEFRFESSVATWLYRVTWNLAINRWAHRDRRSFRHHVGIDQPFGDDAMGGTMADVLAGGQADACHDAQVAEFSELVSSAMEKLPERQRALLTLRTLQGLTYDEISAALGMNIGTVKSAIARARMVLLRILREQVGCEVNSAADFFERPRQASLGLQPAGMAFAPGHRSSPRRDRGQNVNVATSETKGGDAQQVEVVRIVA